VQVENSWQKSQSARMSENIISVVGLNKLYASGHRALDNIHLNIKRGEIFALLGPNGAGKSTLINIICGTVKPSSGNVFADGFDILKDYRRARAKIGLVPQELTVDMWESVLNTVNFSRGLFNKPANPQLIEKILKDLSLWDKRDQRIMALSGGMKRRVLIAKALSHEPEILFLDEPTAGVDVELRHDMWRLVRRLRESGVTIILTTHYLEEAEDLADRIGVINKGRLILVEEKRTLMSRLGKKQLVIDLKSRLSSLPEALKKLSLELSQDGSQIVYTFDIHAEQSGMSELLRTLGDHNIDFKDLHTSESSLEDIFVKLVGGKS
jgi:ABC-2 type transport system ATP-binding protein